MVEGETGFIVFCLKVFIDCSEKKFFKGGENSGWDLEVRCFGQEERGTLPQA